MSVSAAARHADVLPAPESYLEVGFNYRMTDIQAALGVVQLGRLSEMVARRRYLAEVYTEQLSDQAGLRPVADPDWGRCNFQSFWVEVGPESPVDRDELMIALAEQDISARRGIMSAHRQPPYRHLPHGPLAVTEHLTDTTLILPLFHTMTECEQERVIDVVRSAGR